MTAVAKFSIDDAPRAISANGIRKPQTESNVAVRCINVDEEEDNEAADCPPAYLLVELNSKIADLKITEKLIPEPQETTRGKKPTAV